MVWQYNQPKNPVSPEDRGEALRSYPVTSDAFRTMKLWFEQQIENAQQDQISGFAERSERGTIRGEKAHSRHCAMFDALQMFLSEFGTGPVAQAAGVPRCWEARNIGKDGTPWSGWYIVTEEPTAESMKFDGVFSYEFRPLYAGPALSSTDHK